MSAPTPTTPHRARRWVRGEPPLASRHLTRLGRGALALLVGLVVAVFGAAPPVASASPEQGITWLEGQAQADGSFGRIPLRDTEVALAALDAWGGAGEAGERGALYCYYADTGVVELRARQARVLAAAGLPTDEVSAWLAGAAASAGGWGLGPGWPAGLADTSQVLQALFYLDDAELDQVSAGLSFVLGQQLADGGFAWEDNAAGDPLLTAEVLGTLVLWRDVFALDEAIEGAAAWLYGQQGSDGLIAGGIPVLNTALTLRVTSTLSGHDAGWLAAYNALVSAQRVDGSWLGEVYPTAQALLALSAGRPDLVVKSIVPQGDPLIEDTVVPVVVTVKNEGRVGLGQAVGVELVYVSGATGASAAVGSRSLTSLAAGAETTLTMDWDLTDLAGAGFLRAEADPTDTLHEKDRADNVLLQAVSVLGGADLGVLAAESVLQPGDPAPQDTLQFFGKVHSYSAVTLTGVPVTLHDGDPASGGTLLKSWTLTLSPGEAEEVAWSGSLGSGTHQLYLRVDPAGAIEEEDETNNVAVTTVTVAPRIDLTISSGQVRAAPSTLADGQTVTLSVTVYNGGRSPSGAFKVGGYIYHPASMASLSQRVLGAETSASSLPAGQSGTYTLTFPVSGYLGSVSLYGVADAPGLVTETNETNNEHHASVLVVEAPNLQLTSFSPPATATEGETLSLRATVKNAGGATLYNVPVGFFYDTAAGTRIGTGLIQQLDPGQSKECSTVSWATTSAVVGSRTVVAKVDPDAALSESNEADNERSGPVLISPKPDLAFASPALSVSPASPEQGQVVTLTAALRNLTSNTVATSFSVKFWDGSPTGGGTLIGTATVAGIAGNGTAAPSVSWDTEGEAGRHTVYVVADADGAVGEGTEANNQGSLTVTVTSGEADLQPPTGLTTSVAGDNVTLSWTPSGNPAGYRIYRDGRTVNPADLGVDLLSGATVTASSEVASHGVALARDGSNGTYWQGATDVDQWTLEAQLAEAQEVSAFKVVVQSQGNLALSMAFQTWDGRYWYTQDSTTLTSAGTGAISGVFRLKRAVITDRVRVFMTRSDPAKNPAAVAEWAVNPPGLVTGSTFTDINVDADTHAYEVRSANGGGREGEPAEASVAVGDVSPPTNPLAVPYADRTELFWTASTSASNKGYELVRDNLPLVYTSAMSGLSAVASSTASGYAPSAGVDANGTTFWLSATGGPWTYDVTLPQTKRIWSVSLSMVSGKYATSYDILGWTGSEWIVEEEVRDNVFTSRGHLFAQFGATNKIRIRVNAASSTQVGLYEVAVVSAVPITSTGIIDSYRPDYAITYRIGAMSDKHVAFADEEPFVPPSGEEPPLPPSSLSVTTWTRTDLTLGWPAVTSATLAGYNVYDTETGARLNSALLTSPSYVVAGAIRASDTSYGYAVSAVNTFGYESPYFTSTTWTPPLPATPTLTAAVAGTTVNLSWTEATEPLRDGFVVYKDNALLVNTPLGPYADLDVTAGSHSYKVAAYDMFGRQGSFSSSKSVTVVRTDLVVTAEDLAFTPAQATVLDTATLSAAVFNAGNQSSASASVKFYDGDPGAGGVLIGTASLPSIAAYGLRTVNVSWVLAGKQGAHEVYAVVDPDARVAEINEANNIAHIPITVYGEPGFAPTLGTVSTAAFPVLTAPLTVLDTFGQPVTGLGARYVTVGEPGGAGGEIGLAATASPGVYTLTWKSPTLSRNGSTRAVVVTVVVDNLDGQAQGSYVAPSNPLKDLTVTAVVASPGAPQEDEPVNLVVTVLNQGSETETAVPVRIYRGSVGGEVVGAGAVPTVAAGASATVTVGAVALAGTTSYVAKVDPDDVLTETNEANNTAGLDLFAPANPLADLYVEAADIGFSPTAPQRGDQVTVSAVVGNRGAATTNVAVQAYLGDPSSGGKPIGQTRTIGALAKGEEVTVTFSWDTTGVEGSQSVLVWADPLARITERDETNNRASRSVTVSAPRVGLSLSTDKAAYSANTDVVLTARVNPNGAPFTGSLEVHVQDAAGVDVEVLATREIGPISAETPYLFTWNTASTLAGAYQLLVVLREGAAERQRKTAAFTVNAVAGLSAVVSSAASAYDPFASVGVSGALTNSSANTALGAVAATLSLVSPAGATVDSRAVGPQDLALGQVLPLAESFNLGDGAPGVWTVRLAGAAGAPTATANASATFTVRSTADTGVGLLGDLSLDRDQVLPGDPVVANLTLENRGNAAVTALPGRVQVLSDLDGAECSSATFSLTLAKGATQTRAVELSTDCEEGAYSAVLQVSVGGSWRTFDRQVLNLLSILGTITAAPAEAEGGVDTVSITYRATNQDEGRLDDLDFTAELSAADTGEVVEAWPWQVDLDPGQSAEVTRAVDTTSLSLGAYTVDLLFTPDGGEPAVLATARFEVIDSVAPVSGLSFDGITAAEGGVTYLPPTTRVSLSATDNFAGVASVQYRLNGGSAGTYTTPLVFGTEGARTLGFWALDLAGNREAEREAQLVVDVNAPRITLGGVAATCTTEAVTPTVDVEDVSPTTVTTTLNGRAWDGAPIEAVGRYVFVVNATDILGRGASASLTFDVVAEACSCEAGSGCQTPVADGDGDGFTPAEGDCDDLDGAVNPGATEVCDGVDGDCDGVVDDGLDCGEITPRPDTDDDGWADGEDCDTEDPSTYPGAPERCDGIDHDCDGRDDEGCGGTPTATATPTPDGPTPTWTVTPSAPPTPAPTPTVAHTWPTEPDWTPDPSATVPQTTPIQPYQELPNGCECNQGAPGSAGWMGLVALWVLGRVARRRRLGG